MIPAKKIQSTKRQVLWPYPRRARYYPPDDSTQITRGLGSYTHLVCASAPSGELTPILPPGRFYSNHPGTWGLHPLGALTRTLWRTNSDEIETPPGRFYPNHPGLGGYTHRVRSRAPSGELTPTKPKHPPGDSAQTTRGLGGYCREPNTGVPKEMELITIER